jgi:Spy/CpxP family protein refolding chaperone
MLTLGLCLLMGVSLIGSAVHAQPKEPGVDEAQRHRAQRRLNRPLARLLQAHGGRLMALRAELNITPEQRQQIRQAVRAHRQSLLSTTRAAVEHRQALREAVLSGQVNEAEIRGHAQAVGEALGEAAVARATLVQELRPILSEDQRQMIEQFLDQAAQRTDAFFDRALDKAQD